MLARRWQIALRGRIRLKPSRNEWEYVHRVEDLVALKGNRFRSKAQKVRRFMEVHRPEFEPLGGANLGEVRAFQGEPLDEETVVIRFEKASPEFRDAYQAMNRLFLEHSCQGFVWVNREEDMGDPGMREAKMSYRPERFVEKFTVTLE